MDSKMARVSILLLLSISIMVSSVWTTVLPEAIPLDQEPNDPMSKDEETIKSLRDAIFKIQAKHQSEMEEMEEIVRAFNTLQLVANNPALMAGKSNAESNLEEMGTGILNRRRRDDGQSTPAPSDGQQQTPTPLKPGDGQSYLGPYPMCSGQCFLCPAGREGPRGPPGLQGAAGRDGRDGRDAVTQPCQPAEGPPPPIDETTATPPVAATGQPPSPYENEEGVVYTRWGNSDCANGSELVYAGTMAGANYSNTGGGSNWLCMPSDPIYDEVVSGTSVYRGLVYSAEYTVADGPNSMRASHDHTPTCAVCMATRGRISKVMIPARNVCPSDSWKLEYAGYLMAPRYGLHRADYICVDREMEFEPGSGGDQGGAVLHAVEAICVVGAGLPCAPYVSGYELTCAVCTI